MDLLWLRSIAMKKRYLAIGGALLLLFAMATAFILPSGRRVEAGALPSEQVHEILKAVSTERWQCIRHGIAHLEFNVTRSHLREIAFGRRWLITAAEDQAFVQVEESSNSGRAYSYQLE